VLIVDELGVREIERRQGWLAGLCAIDAGDYRWGVVIIRPELLSVALQRWPRRSGWRARRRWGWLARSSRRGQSLQ
jgi:hypothetical protein